MCLNRLFLNERTKVPLLYQEGGGNSVHRNELPGERMKWKLSKTSFDRLELTEMYGCAQAIGFHSRIWFVARITKGKVLAEEKYSRTMTTGSLLRLKPCSVRRGATNYCPELKIPSF